MTDYAVTVAASFDDMSEIWERMAEEGAALAFQRRPWLDAWRRTMGARPDLECLALTVRDSAGRPVMGLPLVRQRRRLRRIGFVDGGLADYNAPILGIGAPQDGAGAAALWTALLRALPPADLVRFERMPRRVGALLNPLALLPRARMAATRGLSLALPSGYAAWRGALPRRYRMELGRCARLFDALPDARFAEVGDADGLEVFDALERLQRQRIAALDLDYRLDAPDARACYRALAADLDRAPGVLTALRIGDAVVAALFGLRFGRTFVMLRIGADEAHGRFSPARLLITRTMEMLSARGVDEIDFGLGDYPYKRKLGGEPVELVDLVAARSAFGLLEVADHRLRSTLRDAPRAHAVAKRLRQAVSSPRFGPRAPA